MCCGRSRRHGHGVSGVRCRRALPRPSRVPVLRCRMHAVGLHSALAIRRERKRRAEQQRARERRYSLQSSESGVTSPHCSTGSLERRRRKPRHAENEVVSSVGMLHLGVVFLVLGVFLVGSGWLPDNLTSWSSVGSVSWFNELVCSGLFSLAVGIFLIALHKYLTKSEEDALEDYVQRQLTRSRSGHRLERDAETGGMHTKNARRARADAQPVDRNRSPSPEEARAHGFLNALALNGDAVREGPGALEQIVEEECSMVSEGSRTLAARDHFGPCALSLSPPSPSDTRELLADPRYMIMSRIQRLNSPARTPLRGCSYTSTAGAGSGGGAGGSGQRCAPLAAGKNGKGSKEIQYQPTDKD
ncbi:hypothetical protein EVAR_44839_1 [Eumeta japonica]|uniref:Uncharacterized protein n=1 Tax=Eumeta variegata TaxID=151549 RepID=A0A4C1YNT8_EUMVA|nr:hypothetical protein EVAR_44839_1 [Eumeta japonica]